jgi:voltage-gated potassium channel Kch
MEMGALIAGISLATFPYNLDVLAKVVSIRDFFITLFFVALGMQIPLPELNVVLTALVLTAVALAIRIFGVFWVLYPLKTGHRVSLLTTINLNQISEFSLVILTLGVGYGHVESKTITYVIWVFSLMAVGSTYLIMYSHELQGLLSKLLIVLGIKDVGGAEEGRPESSEHPVVVLGFYRVASALLNEISRNAGHLLDKIKVVDFNPLVKDRLAKMGVACVYGDISHVVTLAHAEIAHAKVVLCTIPDYILKGTTNLKLFRLVKAVCPNAKVILTSEGPTQAKELFDAGADYVIQPSALAGSAVVGVIEQALEGRLDELKDAAVTDLTERSEVLS